MAHPVIYNHTIDPAAAQMAYAVVIDALIAAGINRAEAMVGLLTVIATQYKGGVLSAEEMEDFTLQASQWLNTYFMEGEES